MFHKKKTFILIKLLISISILAFLLKKTGLDMFSQTFVSIDLKLCLLCAMLYIVAQYLSSLRWKVLLVAHNIRVTTLRLFSFYLVGMFFNNFLPGSIGGDAVKGYDLYRYSKKGKESITTVFLERYTGLAALLLIGLVSLIFIYSLPEDYLVKILILGITATFIAGTIIVINSHVKNLTINLVSKLKIEKIKKAIFEIFETFGKYENHKSSFLNAVLLSIIIQVMNIFVYIILSNALDITVPWSYFFFFFPIITVISMLPISINGLGVREGINVYLFAQVGVTHSKALSLSISWFLMVTAISLLGGLVFVFRK
ncbi:MAG: YbhN family protein [Candidatus Scalinduaceae bacterium]